MIEFVYNNTNYNFIDCSSFYLLYDFNSKIHYEIENDFVEKKISTIKNRIKHLHEMKQILTKRLKYVNFKQTKYYNKKYKFMKYHISDLIILSIKNFKQKRFNKKISYKFVTFFKIKNKTNAQIYRLTLFIIYRIHNIFHVFLLKKYYYRVDDQMTKQIIQTFDLINDKKQWKIDFFFHKTKNKKNIWYKIKWLNLKNVYNQWLFAKKLENTLNLIKKFDEQTSRKRRRKI